MKLKRASIFTKIVIAALVLYAAVSIVSVRAELRETEARRDELASEVTEKQRENTKLEYDIAHGAEDDAMEDIARDKLGLVKPGEKIFYDISD